MKDVPGAGPPALEFERVTFAYSTQPVIQDVTFSVERGQFVALVGPNGGGKTTLLRLALGLLRPQDGLVKLWNQHVERFHDWSRVAYVPQQAASVDGQFPSTVQEVTSFGEYRGFNPLAILSLGPSSAVREALEVVGMWEHRAKRLTTLSTGQQQRVLIARALVKGPELMLLDEPTAGVDTPSQERFYGLLKELNSTRKITVVLVSHDVGTVLKAADRVACINQRLVYHGAPESFPIQELPAFYGLSVTPLEHHHE